ncbi:MAG: hypothetical protein KC800_14670 [Candidatus Eremiobacteraeota bacterium]|nr:hypothetical protein [Candidatus Eremiobacteraeota bacterium]
MKVSLRSTRSLPSNHLSPPKRQYGVQSDSTGDRFTPSTDLEKARDRGDSNPFTLGKLAFALLAAAPAVGALTGGAQAQEVAIETTLTTPAEVDLAQQQQVQPGTLIVSDFFDNRAGTPHGEVVEKSSRELGFKNSIVKKQVQENASTRIAERYYSRLDARSFSPEEIKDFTYDYMLHRQMGSLQSAGEELDALNQAGTRNSVLNLSRGWGKAQIMESLYERTRIAWDATAHPQSRVVGERRLNKLAPAFGLKAQDIMDNVGDSRAKFQQGILNLLDEVGQDDRLAAAQKRYDGAVSRFESNNNSVVVAAANSGRVLSLMALDAPTPELAPDFFRNRLANDEVTTVGATRASGGAEQVADYTNLDPGIDFYADGQIDGAWGTSFATPRTGSVMAQLHKDNPQASSAEVEAMLNRDFSHELTDYGSWVKAPALKEAEAASWLKAK